MPESVPESVCVTCVAWVSENIWGVFHSSCLKGNKGVRFVRKMCALRGELGNMGNCVAGGNTAEQLGDTHTHWGLSNPLYVHPDGDITNSFMAIWVSESPIKLLFKTPLGYNQMHTRCFLLGLRDTKSFRCLRIIGWSFMTNPLTDSGAAFSLCFLAAFQRDEFIDFV